MPRSITGFSVSQRGSTTRSRYVRTPTSSSSTSFCSGRSSRCDRARAPWRSRIALAAFAVTVIFAVSSAASANGGSVVRVGPSNLGRILVDAHGKTLYMWAHDKSRKSTCYGDCAEYWPPLLTRGAPSARSGARATGHSTPSSTRSPTSQRSMPGMRLARDLGGAVDHAAQPRDDVERPDLCTEGDVLLQARRAVGAGEEPRVRVRPRAGDGVGGLRRIGGVRSQQLDDPAGAVGVVEREPALEAGADDHHVLAAIPSRGRDGVEVEQAPEEHLVGSGCRLEDRARAVRGREDHRRGARLAQELPRRGADVEAFDPDRVPLAAEQALPQLVATGERFFDLAAAVDPFVAGSERLRDRRGGPQNIHHDPERGVRRLAGRKGDVGAHPPTTLPRWPRRRRCTAIDTRIARPASRARSAAGASARTAWSSHRSASDAPTTPEWHRELHV